MIWKSSSLVSACLLVVCAVDGTLVCRAQDKVVKKRSGSMKANLPDTFVDPASGPFNLAKTLDLVRGLADGTVPNRTRVLDAFRNRSVDFTASPENLDAIKKAGADAEFVALINKIALPYTPPVPPSGSIAVICAPAECDVSTGDAKPVVTKDGKATLENVPVGEVQVSFRKTGYVSSSQTVKVSAKTVASVSATLAPDKAARAAEASEWLSKVWTAIGSGDRGSAQQDILASGSASLFDAGGNETHWGISVKIDTRSSSQIDLQTAAGKPAFRLECDPCHLVKGSGKNKSIDHEEVSVLITWFRRVHFGSMISRLTAPEVRPLSTDVLPSGNRIVLLEGNDETYEAEFGPALLIARVLAKSKYSGETYQVIYGDYSKLSDTAKYPRRTEFHLGTGKRSFKIEFSGSMSKLS